MIAGEGADFSFDQVSDFDGHIAREIRGYDLLDTIATGLADAVIDDGTTVYDIGSSTGRFLIRLATMLDEEDDSTRKRNVRFIGFEPCEHLADSVETIPPNVEIVKSSVTPETSFENASLISSIFTMQFLPIHQREAIIKNIYEGLNDGGAFIWAEKVHASDARIEHLLTGLHNDFKREGSSAQDIMDKEKRLRAIMRPLDEHANRSMLEAVGFEKSEVFWRVNNFMAILALK